jgi:hypothetical protein
VRVGFTPTPRIRSSPAPASSASAAGKAAEEGSPGTSSSSGGRGPAGRREAGGRASGTRLRRHLHAESPQHALGVVAGEERLGDGDRDPRAQAGQEDGALDLRAGLRRCVGDLAQRPAEHLDRQPVRLAQLAEGGAHLPERRGDAAHGPAAERGVPGERRGEGARGEQPHHQPRRGAAVAAVQHLLRHPPRPDAAAADHDRAPVGGGIGDVAPSARSTAAVLRQSAPGRSPRSRLSPSATAASIRARWVTDLSPGTARSPRMCRVIGLRGGGAGRDTAAR